MATSDAYLEAGRSLHRQLSHGGVAGIDESGLSARFRLLDSGMIEVDPDVHPPYASERPVSWFIEALYMGTIEPGTAAPLRHRAEVDVITAATLDPLYAVQSARAMDRAVNHHLGLDGDSGNAARIAEASVGAVAAEVRRRMNRASMDAAVQSIEGADIIATISGRNR